MTCPLDDGVPSPGGSDGVRVGAAELLLLLVLLLVVVVVLTVLTEEGRRRGPVGADDCCCCACVLVDDAVDSDGTNAFGAGPARTQLNDGHENTRYESRDIINKRRWIYLEIKKTKQ